MTAEDRHALLKAVHRWHRLGERYDAERSMEAHHRELAEETYDDQVEMGKKIRNLGPPDGEAGVVLLDEELGVLIDNRGPHGRVRIDVVSIVGYAEGP